MSLKFSGILSLVMTPEYWFCPRVLSMESVGAVVSADVILRVLVKSG